MGEFIPLHKPTIFSSSISALKSTFNSGWVGEGPKVRQLEKVMSKFIGTENVLALNCCTSAIELSIHLLNLHTGDEVISTPMTCAAMNIPFVRRGINLRWADIDPYTGNIDPYCLPKHINKKTKAIIVVHWGGYPCDMKEIYNFSKQNKLHVIEDAAHAFGSEYKGKMIGNHGDFVCISFQAIKTITSGDGGLLIVRDYDMFKKAKLLRWYGIDREGRDHENLWDYDINIAGFKYSMNDIAATILLEGMLHLQDILKARKNNANYYNRELKDINRIELLRYDNIDHKSSYWLYTILVERRDDCIRMLKEKKIGCGVVHKRNDLYSIFSGCKAVSILHGVDYFYNKYLCIPVGPWVTNEQRERIVYYLKRGW